jgi:hypothetical protein
MSIGLLPNGGINNVIDYSDALVNLPNQWKLFDALNIFDVELKTQAKVGVPIYDEVLSVLGDKNWEVRADSLKRSVRRVLNFDIPRFPVRESITPRDTAGIVSFEQWTKGDGIVLETVNSLRDEKLRRMKTAMDQTAELARAQLITAGSVYAPNGTLAQSYGSTINWFNEFGVAQTVFTGATATALGNSATDPRQYWEAVTAAVQDGLVTGSFYDQLVCVCSATYFQALIYNDYYSDNEKSNQVIGNRRLEQRLNAMGMPIDIRYRSIEIDGILFIEHRGKKPDGTDYVPTGKAFVFPLGVQDMFKVLYAPALGRWEYQNKIAQPVYAWEFYDINNETQEIAFTGESNFVHYCGRPQALIQLSLT